MKISQQKLAVPATKSSTKATTKKVKVAKKPKGKTTISLVELSQPTRKTYVRRKYTPVAKSDEEIIKSDDMSQFKVVSHNPSSNLGNVCDNVKSNACLSGFAHIDFDKLEKVE